jgi:hypothetical protein
MAGLAGSIDETLYDNRYEVLTGLNCSRGGRANSKPARHKKDGRFNSSPCPSQESEAREN